uniref:Uncharacterized protein n=1 Tax=Amphimedon queenslandica TaxID=400682 RepID=A0A1X7VN28_AMPQE
HYHEVSCRVGDKKAVMEYDAASCIAVLLVNR